MAWTLIGAAPVVDTTERVVVGPVEVPPAVGLVLKVSSPVSVPAPGGWALLTFESIYGRELGAIRVWPRPEPTVYRFGQGLRARSPRGLLVLEPRQWNQRWLRAGFSLSVVVLADLPDPVTDGATLAPGLASPDGLDLFLTPSGGAGRVTFPE
jgi:hypothetical protein